MKPVSSYIALSAHFFQVSKDDSSSFKWAEVCCPTPSPILLSPLPGVLLSPLKSGVWLNYPHKQNERRCDQTYRLTP